jgi:putative ABC transport system permease protein
VSGGFFNALGLCPAAGRLISDSDDQRGCPAVGVLSYGFWEGHYGGAKSVIGSTLSLSDHPVQVVGVAPRGFFGMDVGQSFDVALPICATSVLYGNNSRLDNRAMWWLNVGGRLSPRLSSAQLAARLRVLSPVVMGAAVPPGASPEEEQAYLRMVLAAVPVARGISSLQGHFTRGLEVLMAIVGVVLLIACANIAGMMLACTAARHKEIAVRRALGASRNRLVRQLLTETALLTSFGAVIGILLAHWSTILLVRMISTTQNTVSLNLSPDGRVLGFVVVVAALTALLLGALPAVRSARVSLTSAMKGSQSPEAGQSRGFTRVNWVVACQVTFSLVLLAAAGLLLRSFVRLDTLDLGFDPHNVLLVHTDLDAAKLPVDAQDAAYKEIQSGLDSLPGVLSVSRSVMSPMCGTSWYKRTIQSYWSASLSSLQRLVFFNFVTPGYLRTLRTPLLEGRSFTADDTRSSQSVAIVNQTMARMFFPGLHPIGQTFRFEVGVGRMGPPIEVVGVMKDSKYGLVQENSHPTVFMPLIDVPGRAAGEETFELRTKIPLLALTGSIQAAVGRIGKEIPLRFDTVAARVSDSLVQQRLMALLSGFFGALALLLAAIGVFGTMSYSVTQRRTEFGVRMALGARRGDVLKLVVWDGLKLTLVGLVVGIAAALGLTHFLSRLLYGVEPTDPLTFVIVSVVLVAVALVACLIPAYRASKMDPMVALHYE